MGGQGGRPVMTNKPAAADLAKALAAMETTGRGPSRASPVHQWLEANYDALALAFRRKPPSWTKLADYLGEHGVTGAEGRRPTPETVPERMASAGRSKSKTARLLGLTTCRGAGTAAPRGPRFGDEYDFAKTPFVR